MARIIYHVGRKVLVCWGEGAPSVVREMPDAASAQAEAVIMAARLANMGAN